jgi:diaminopimelate epimerase
MTTSLSFSKMHGLGNDFMVVNQLESPFHFSTDTIKKLSNRHIGVGFDQLLLIEPSQRADYFCRIYNADGSEAEMCGNGLRCVALYLQRRKLITDRVSVETKAGIFPIDINDANNIRVTMPVPVINEKQLSLNDLSMSVLSLGNPHAIIKVDSIDHLDVTNIAATLAANPFFKNGVNVGFMQIITPAHVKLRTVERGAGETCACGSNASAAAVAGIMNGWLEHKVDIEYRYGTLQIEWAGEGKSLYMTGPAVFVFDGITSI